MKRFLSIVAVPLLTMVLVSGCSEEKHDVVLDPNGPGTVAPGDMGPALDDGGGGDVPELEAPPAWPPAAGATAVAGSRPSRES